MSKKILVVDDEPDVVNYLCSLLQDSGYQTLSASNGKEGTQIAKKELPDLICLDITMPEESGVKLLRNLHDDKTTSKIPIAIVSGIDPSFEGFIKARKQVEPPAAYFEKPIDKDEFLKKIAQLVSNVEK